MNAAEVDFIGHTEMYADLTSSKDVQSLGFNKPKLAVAALNPHGGENGLFGYEVGRKRASPPTLIAGTSASNTVTFFS